jgi:hypothetical protein
MDSPDPPPAPDPFATAQAQGQMNKETAIAQTHLNMVNQRTPQGSLTYNRVGTWGDAGGGGGAPMGNGGIINPTTQQAFTNAGGVLPNGGVGDMPRYEAVVELSPEQQELYRLNTETQRNIGQIGVDQSKRIGGALSAPVNLNNEATEARLMELGRKRLDPMFEQRRATLETKLYNQGLQPGTEAWNRAMTEQGQQENDAYTQLLLSGRGQAVQEALTERNQPINEITALLRGSGVQQPSFVGTPQSNVAPVDYTGLVSNNYNAQMAGYNAERQQQGAMLGAIGGMAGTALGGWGSGGFKKFW